MLGGGCNGRRVVKTERAADENRAGNIRHKLWSNPATHSCFAEVGWYQLNLEKQWETHPGDRHLIWVWKLKKKCKTIFRESAVCLELLETTLGVIVIFLNPMTIPHFYPFLKCRQVISSSPSCNHWTNETWFTARVRPTLLEMLNNAPIGHTRAPVED